MAQFEIPADQRRQYEPDEKAFHPVTITYALPMSRQKETPNISVRGQVDRREMMLVR
jgi:hypothetical protein